MVLNEMAENYYSGFKKISLQFITAEEFKQIEKTSVHLRFKKGETILKQGHQPTHIAFLQSGIVKFNFFSEGNGKNTILTLVSAPKILGGANLFYKDNNLFSIVAVEDCEVFLIESNILFELLKKNGRFAVALFQIASDMFKQSILNFISVANKQKEGRIADVFLYLSGEIYFGTSFNLSLTRKELAEFACCSVENVIMTLSKWQQEEIITISGKKVEIKDINKLKQISKIG
ncbi:MAG: Crp/Fnr family transcriptional regulator [Bacteroidales bacterium]|jgi:CRP-like cAMP-binding protein|nr:Crp/Fnr family transcriptional regulator [Bacteroidales bacterium]